MIAIFKVDDVIITNKKIKVLREEYLTGCIYKIETDKHDKLNIYVRTFKDGFLKCLKKNQIKKIRNGGEKEMLASKGKIMKVLEKDGITPKDHARWNRDITYIRETIEIGYQAMLFYDEGQKVTQTSYITDIKEDENNLIIHTENSIYYIKKILL